MKSRPIIMTIFLHTSNHRINANYYHFSKCQVLFACFTQTQDTSYRYHHHYYCCYCCYHQRCRCCHGFWYLVLEVDISSAPFCIVFDTISLASASVNLHVFTSSLIILFPLPSLEVDVSPEEP